ncbi:hypothetical protein CGBL_0126460 [Corynebacterium glutamicum]|nr:hypothetical protein CGBL_0126460 [Corynebacterium glutamicum]
MFDGRAALLQRGEAWPFLVWGGVGWKSLLHFSEELI